MAITNDFPFAFINKSIPAGYDPPMQDLTRMVDEFPVDSIDGLDVKFKLY